MIESNSTKFARIELIRQFDKSPTTYSTVIKRRAVICRIELTGTDNRRKAGRPRIITPELLEYVIALIERNATLYQDEVADFIYMEFGIQLD